MKMSNAAVVSAFVDPDAVEIADQIPGMEGMDHGPGHGTGHGGGH